ncbi:TetR/AcrR family transcriptional regulator C-terminal domain-containing protein [Telmatospirillum sp. J64-1]|uniref:TetR/AcrR family transcriptional regulator C-terminal domain-containing protein n=1 Tax=Telmatospirillum sp. J64-1 TaxID=2502183 RepID=UPI00163D8006|nr:TetR/AcrR family transcriptional regulator C-terminal domain-containing protein [Telmatospirillum sp. J64-1]
MSQRKIDRNSIVMAALAALDEVGIEGLSMRMLAERLKVQAPTLYWHFASKDALLDAMADAIIAPALDARLQEGADIFTVARAFRAALLTYRDGAQVFAGRYEASENVLVLGEWWLDRLVRAGLEPDKAVHQLFNLSAFIIGFCIEEQRFHEKWPEGKPDQETLALFRSSRFEKFPLLAAYAASLLSGSFDERFEVALQMYSQAIGQPGAA